MQTLLHCGKLWWKIVDCLGVLEYDLEIFNFNFIIYDVKFLIQGQDDWRKILTLPNILKEFNPDLFGYSLGDSYNVHKSSQFNVAENIATTSDMPYNAAKLMHRMKADRRVSMENHWKLITLMVGGNDFW